MKKYEKYKKIDLHWLSEIPKHWSTELLKNFAKYGTGNSISDEEKENYRDIHNAIPYISTSNINLNNNTINYLGGLYIKNTDKNFKIAPKNATLVCIEGGSGGKKKGIINQNVCFVNKLCYIKSFKHDDRFVYYSILSEVFNYNYCLNISGDRNGVSINKIKEFKFIIPPLEEQKQIANYLDWKINEIDKEIDNHLDKIKKMKEYKDSYVKKLVNYGVGKANKLKKIENNVFEFIPQNWQNRYIFQVSTENKVKNNNMKNRNLLSLSYGKIIEKNIDKTDGLLPESFETYQIIKTGMIVLRLTDLQNDHKSLRVGICKSTGIITSAYVVLKVTEEILPEYMYYLLHSFDISKGLYGMGRGVRQSLNYKDFSTILIPLPSLKEQRLIVDACEKIDLNIKKMIDSISKKIELLKELKNSIISEVVTGKIDVRDVIIPKYEKLNVNEVIKEDSFEKGIENDDE